MPTRCPLPRLALLLLTLPALLAACASAPPAVGGPERLRFAIVGDAPYNAAEVPRWERFLQQWADDGAAFVLHVGDIKGGGEPCTDALLNARVAQLRASPVPLLLALGDNEWTDCHRRAAGAFLPTERLAALRRMAYADPRLSLGSRPLAVDTQASTGGLPEHQAFERQGIRVATLHVVGSRNGLAPWGDLGDGQADSAQNPRPDRLNEVRAREAAVSQWLRHNVARAASPEVQGLVLVFQANPGLEAAPGAAARIGFEGFVTELRHLLAPLGKPVLLVHGDFHHWISDTPFPELPHVQRVQTWGSPILGGVRVRVLDGQPLRWQLDSVLAP